MIVQRAAVWTMTMLAAAGVATTAAAADSFKVDAVHSSVLFRIKHLNVSYYHGRFNDVSGTFALDAADPTKCTFDVVVQTESVDTHNEKRNGHLKSPDFLNAREFPTITFKSTAVKAAGDDKLEVTGDLTLHGVTKSITVIVEQTGRGPGMAGEQRAGIEVVFTIQRSEFGMGGMLNALGDEVRLTVALEGVSQ